MFDEVSPEEAAAAEKKKEDAAAAAKKPVKATKSIIILDIKPLEDTTDMMYVDAELRKTEVPGLIWGTSKLVDVAFGIKKLVMTVVIEDDKVGGDDLEELITKYEDHVQSVDIASWNKL